MGDLITALGVTATSVAGDIVSVAVGALVVLGAFYGIRLVIRAFKMVK